MIKRILIANRGEIAIRVIRTCREMDITTVAVYSEADRNSLHVMLADEAYFIGPAQSQKSYLNIDKLLRVAKQAKVDAVHPGYGFLSESPEFARRLKEAGFIFIGATEENITLMGDKLNSRETVKALGVPTVPGSKGSINSFEEAKELMKTMDYPVIIKASAGGGGKGIRIVHKEEDLKNSFFSCQSEGKNYFNDDRVFMEKYITSPKHIEVQVFADSHGHVVHLFDRECSVQRRHQKLLEEAPSPSLKDSTRKEMTELSKKIAKHINYLGAGTIEYIFDAKTHEFYFLEMNTRIQVEHPVTESIVGYDLVREQILVAQGEALSFKQEDIKIRGHSMEVRICAEDPLTFQPHPGKIKRCRLPQGPFVRMDNYAYPGYEVPIYYDPMIAKLIVWGENRDTCVRRLKRALAEFMVTGIKTNVVLQRNILEHEKFLSGEYTTNFIQDHILNKEQKEFFTFVDDHVFLVSSAIAIFEESKKVALKARPSSGWKKGARQEQLRTPFKTQPSRMIKTDEESWS